MTKKESKTLYDGISQKDWVEELEKNNEWNKRHLYALFAMLGTPTTMLDIGCGLGEMVYIANQMQIKAFGVDQLVDDADRYQPAEWYLHHNLQTPFSLAEHRDYSVVDLVICLAFTAAHPGQSGTEHLSERPANFWRDEFHYRGLNFEPEKTARLALHWTNIGSPKFWLASNLQLFSK
jgi:hypothetical protein